MEAISQMNLSVGEAVRVISDSQMSRIFVFDDWVSPHNFWKQFLSGAFIAIVMTGLDQDMMQKNLTCKTLKDAQKDMCTYGVAFVPANLLFLALGYYGMGDKEKALKYLTEVEALDCNHLGAMQLRTTLEM